MAPLGLRFWGTRGLVASPSLDNIIFGGNTPCIQIFHKDKTIVVDTGFGITNLGEILLAKFLNKGPAITCHMLFTHFHWDHIQGLPFFSPIYFPETTIHLYSPAPAEEMLQNLDLLFDGSYSPFSGIKSMPAKIEFHQLTGNLDLDGLKVSYHPVNHNINNSGNAHSNAFAYRFDANESITIVTDHEAAEGPLNDRVVEFAKGTDVLIHDAHYTDEDYQKHQGWGHSSYAQALDNCAKVRAKLSLLTHHAPQNNDDKLLSELKKIYRDPRFHSLELDLAREGHDIMCDQLGSPSELEKAS